MNAETQSNIQRAIGDLSQLREQWAGVESIDKEREKVEAKLAGVKQNVAAMRAEFNEVKTAHDKILAKAHEEQAKLEKLQAENAKLKRELEKLKGKKAAPRKPTRK